MIQPVINEEALEHVVTKLDSFVWADKEDEERELIRQQFGTTYNKEKIDNLKKEDYYAGLGRKQGCIAYDLEWGTKKLGSIKGGSKYKYGYETDFSKIKSLLQKITSINANKVYEADGLLQPNQDVSGLAMIGKEIMEELERIPENCLCNN